MATLEPLPVGADPFAGGTGDKDPGLEPLPPGTDPFVNVLGGGSMTAEGVAALLNQRPRSALGLRARAVNGVPGPTQEDIDSPIDTADIIEGRQRIAAAEAQKRADSWLERELLPAIGTPIRINRGTDALEGIVTDAWDDGDEPGISVEAADGMFLDVSLPRMRAAGVEIQQMPVPMSQQDIDKEAQEVAKAREKAEKEAEQDKPPPIMRFDGQPFRTRESADLSARTRGIEAQPIETQGGWALQPAGKEPLDEEARRKIDDVTQIAQRALPALGSHHAAIGIKRRNKAIASRDRGLPNADFRLLERHGIAEDPTQAATFLGAVNKAQKEGKSPKAGTGYAMEVLAGSANPTDAPESPKFQSFMETQIGFALGVPRREVQGLLGGMVRG